MINKCIDGVDFICANTDAQALDKLDCRTILKLGPHVTRGLGAGGRPEIGRQAAMEDRERIREVIDGADMVFIGDVTGNYMGSEDWDRIAVVRYATRKSFIEMQSRKDFGEKHVHKNAGMQRTVIVCCRPEDTAIDTRERPAPSLELRTVAMIVRQTPQRDAAFAALPELFR